jgi:hypothetical protein
VRANDFAAVWTFDLDVGAIGVDRDTGNAVGTHHLATESMHAVGEDLLSPVLLQGEYEWVWGRQRGEVQSRQDPVAIAKRERRYDDALGDQPISDIQLPQDLQGLRVDRRGPRIVGAFLLPVQCQDVMTRLAQDRGQHQARRATTHNNDFDFLGQHHFSFESPQGWWFSGDFFPPSVMRSARARIRRWTVRMVSRGLAARWRAAVLDGARADEQPCADGEGFAAGF